MHKYRNMDPIMVLDAVKSDLQRIRESIHANNYAEAQQTAEMTFGILQQLEHQLWRKAKQQVTGENDVANH